MNRVSLAVLQTVYPASNRGERACARALENGSV